MYVSNFYGLVDVVSIRNKLPEGYIFDPDFCKQFFEIKQKDLIDYILWYSIWKL